MPGRGPTPEIISLLTCRMGDIWFGAPTVQVERVAEISEGLPVISLPGAMPGRETKDTSYLISFVEGKKVAFRIDEMGMVRDFPARAIYPIPDFLKGQCSMALWGVAVEKEHHYFLLNLSDAIDCEALNEPDVAAL